jgi:DUF4097 and DUF4098 domain-containing protein YvlB
MMLAIIAAASLALAQQTDTTLSVRQGTRLEVENFGGEIAVRAWNQDRVRIQATHSTRDYISVSASASAIRVEAESRRGMAHLVEYQISVPVWMAVRLSGVSSDMRVEGTRGAVSIETVEGAVTVNGGADEVTAESVEGDVVVSGARGRVTAHSVDGEIRLADIVGDIVTESVDGSIIIEGAQATAVDASTVDGDIYYVGTVRDGGRYDLATHDGAVAISIAEGSNATITVATFDGELDSSFPIPLQRTEPNRRFTFTLGSGSARIHLETFDGRILLRRPNEIRIPTSAGTPRAPAPRNDEPLDQ